ncbi:MAG: ABC transporter permease [Spirochaetota bacterium]
MKLVRFVRRRLLRLILTVFIIATMVFFLVRVLPGDPAAVIAGLDADPDSLAAIRAQQGLDRPLVVQYLDWLWSALRFDFGRSFFSNEPAMALIMRRLPLTLLLSLLAFVASVAIAVPLGVLSAVHRWGPIDYAGMVFSQFGMALPGFWLGILLLLVFSVHLRWFPLFGADSLRHLVLPAVALGLGRSALLVRYVRSSTLEELGKDYVVTAEAMGIPRSSIRYRHVLKNALLPVITIAGIQLGYMLGGTILIEQVFSLPGAGRLLLTAIQQRDFAVIQAGVVFLAVAFSFVNFLADVLYTVVNPRIRVG